MKKLLLINRKIVRWATPYMFMLGALMLIIIGMNILSGEMPDIDMSSCPHWVAYVFAYGGVLLVICTVVDLIYSSISRTFRTKWRSDKKTLAQRIKEAETQHS